MRHNPDGCEINERSILQLSVVDEKIVIQPDNSSLLQNRFESGGRDFIPFTRGEECAIVKDPEPMRFERGARRVVTNQNTEPLFHQII